MAKWYDEITDELRAFIEQQHLFFVASAPLADDGHVNLSPKGLDSFRVLNARQVAYLDMTGSGNETSAHLLENGRVTFMFCAFEGPPRILRLYGTGRVVRPGHADWETLAAHFSLSTGTRQIVVADIEKVQTSCGFAVPLYTYQGQRDTLNKWAEARGEEGVRQYWQEKNTRSMDGLPTHLASESAAPPIRQD
ncbi:MAG: pyridoxamine 5'-phosphate oxidase family protein [Anaerolineae bacterium]|nr:pyridoxamine 5'-phosphate oxidase family protein [Anaerolineae bacterium]